MISHHHSSARAEVYQFMLDNINKVGGLGGYHCHLIVIIDHMQQLVIGSDG